MAVPAGRWLTRHDFTLAIQGSSQLVEVQEVSAPLIDTINDPEICRKFIERKPATARAILAAEAGQGTASLGELYEIFEESVRSYETPHRESEAAPAKGAASELSLQQINAMALPDRHQAIQALKDRVGDMSIDQADLSPETLRLERD